VNKGVRHVAFLRAVNVGGRSVVKMTDVQAAFAGAGCGNVTTYIASGNVIFDAPAAGAPALRTRVAGAMQDLLGAAPVIVYRTARELQALVDSSPFGALVDDRRLKLYVAFVLEKPQRKPAFPLSFPKDGLEAIGMVKSDVLVVSQRRPGGMYGFPNNWIEKELGVVATARNWSTVTQLAALAASLT
jgi:uncharacterized protein (DUF1697 family)